MLDEVNVFDSKRFFVVAALLVWGCAEPSTTGGSDAMRPGLDMSAAREDMSPGMAEQDMRDTRPEDMGRAADTGGEVLPEDMAMPDLVSSPPDAGQHDAGSTDDPALLLDAPASTESITHPFTMTMSGSGSGLVSKVEVADNLATVVIDGERLTGVIQERQAWSDFSLVLYQTLLVSEESVHVAWLYCKGDKLDWIYHESNLAPMQNEPLQGSCVDSMTAGTTEVALSPVTFSPPEPIPGYRVDGGDQLQIYGDGQQSFARFSGERYRIYPFEIVDCSRDCGQPGWYEVHSFMEREGDDALGFIIFYLRNAGQVEAHYGIVWPGFDVISGKYFTATWSTP